MQNIDPYTLYPSVSGRLIFNQILIEAGFTADDLLSEALFAQLTVPAANPYEFSQDFRDARQLTAGYFYRPNYANSKRAGGILHEAQFAAEKLVFSYTERKPYHQPDTSTATYFAGRHTADMLGYYNLVFSDSLRLAHAAAR